MQSALTYRTNRDLFSNHYLDEQLPETEEWEEVSDEELQSDYEEIMELWEQEKDTAPKRNESQLEEKFIRPMFRKLGIPFEVEESTSGTQRRPDYGFFETEDAARSAFERREEGGDFYNNAVAVADAKRWGRTLDTSGEKKRDYGNPSHQIDQYLRFTSTTWGVLTNGKKWRLYYKPTSHKLDSYYEIDLPTVLEQGNMEAFKYFYLFFRQEAFLEDATGDCFLDDVYEESNVFAEELGEDLQENIYEAIKVLSEGFMQHSGNDLGEEDLELIHDSSLIYLYRVIFVLYAEAEGRDLLDTDNRIYEDNYSINTLKQAVAEELDSDNPTYTDWQTNIGDRLDELFQLIDQGSKQQGIPEEDLYIPAYNGGLFRTNPDEDDSKEARFLANHEVGDTYLARVIELLTRSANAGNGTTGEGKIFVDYSSLDVRHLGSIYEGLLEYQLHVADEPLAVENGEDGEYVSADEDDDVVVAEGEIYLTTDSGERKATGSYYTPEYVVEYIVENTLGPLVEDIRKDLAGQTAHGEGGFAGEFADRIFELKILDPAMGSGHFLTSAVDYLAREIIDAQEKQAAQEGVETVEEQRDINWARRQVAQRCIYGVDLNPLAVELSKVSLWLRTLAAEQPLAFLDHHLKTGNSLVGSDIETVLDNGDPDNGTEEGQLTLRESFDRTRRQALEHVTDQFEDLLAIDNETLDDIKEMEAVYEEVRDDPLYQHLIAMANVHTAEQFGLDVPGDAYERMAEALRDDSWEEIEGQDWYKSAQAMAEDQHFFHWELEFPIAFYEQDGERKEDGGFDAVVGNPPYVRQEQLSKSKNYFQSKYNVYHSVADLYAYFVENGRQLLRYSGHFGFIISNKFTKAEYGGGLRELLSKKTQLKMLIDFHDLPVFSTSVSAYPMILLFENCPPDGNTVSVARAEDLSFSDLQTEMSNLTHSVEQELFSSDQWLISHPAAPKIIDRMGENTASLLEYFELHGVDDILNGLKTGLNEAFMIDAETKDTILSRDADSEQFIHPLIVGEDINRYAVDFADRYIIAVPSGWTYDNSPYASEDKAWEWFKTEYPGISEYLRKYEKDAKTRHDRGECWWELRPCDYYDVLEEEKIVYPEISSGPRFAYDSVGRYMNNKCFAIPADKRLIGVLNSTLSEFWCENTLSILRGGYQEFRRVHLREFPVASGDTEIPDLVDEMISLIERRHALNLNLLDYLGIPSDDLPDSKAGDTLGEMQMPVAGVADTPLSETTDEYDGLRIEGASFADDGGRVVLSVDISYKVAEDDPRETDRWDRLAESEFETYEAMAFVGLSDAEETLLREFVPVAVEDGDGFAGFRDNATQTNSPLDRLKALTLPDTDEVETGLEQYVEVRERADELEEKIEKTDALIDEIVYDLYGLTDEEIEIVEEAVGD